VIMGMRAAGWSTLAALCAVTAACDRAADGAADDAGTWTPLVTFDTTSARVVTASDTIPLRLEVAEREDQRAYGLMERPHLPADAGMIFTYPADQPDDAGFWMYRTRIPLDIAFLDDAGTILRILHMDPCPSADPRGCRSYPPGVRYRAALEVNRGWFAMHGVTTGDRVIMAGAGTDAAP
jgi:uncharacterized protein